MRTVLLFGFRRYWFDAYRALPGLWALAVTVGAVSIFDSVLRMAAALAGGFLLGAAGWVGPWSGWRLDYDVAGTIVVVASQKIGRRRIDLDSQVLLIKRFTTWAEAQPSFEIEKLPRLMTLFFQTEPWEQDVTHGN